jgi:hypothetical protein
MGILGFQDDAHASLSEHAEDIMGADPAKRAGRG